MTEIIACSGTAVHGLDWIFCTESPVCLLQGANAVQSIHMENVDSSEKLPTQIMEELLEAFSIPSNKQVGVFQVVSYA